MTDLDHDVGIDHTDHTGHTDHLSTPTLQGPLGLRLQLLLPSPRQQWMVLPTVVEVGAGRGRPNHGGVFGSGPRHRSARVKLPSYSVVAV